MNRPSVRQRLIQRQRELRACRDCPRMTGPPVHGEPALSPVFLLGQAPGTREVSEGRPFCWTAGRTLFGWLAQCGLDEPQVRSRVYMSAVCRCFPGKLAGGGDRVPGRSEVATCARWWQGELALLRPRLVIAVGRLAIARFIAAPRLADVIGQVWPVTDGPGAGADLIPLPHPSGASTWFKTEPGRTLLAEALGQLGRHSAWRSLLDGGVGTDDTH
jgi:uracil-DNA glycosylase